MNRQIITAALTGTLAIVASGCAGGDSSAEDSAYCTSYAGSKTAFQDMGSGDIASFGKAFAVFHDLAAQSPKAINVEWQTIDGAFVSLEKHMKAAGLSIEELDGIVSEGTIPQGVDVVALQELMDEMSQLGSTEFSVAADAIEKYGRDTCDVDLSS